MLRLFVAAELPAEVRAALTAARRDLESHPGARHVRWSNLDQAHLTLKFLGDTPEASVPALAECISSVAGAASPFSLTLSGLGAFPSLRRPRVVWAGLQPADGSHTLGDLHGTLERELARLGYAAEDRGFSPHLTLGRVRRGLGPRQLAEVSDMLAAAVPVEPVTFPVSSLNLMSSVLRPEGAIHTRLAEARLGGG